MTEVNEKSKEFAAQLPEVMEALMGLCSEVVKDGALSVKTKELMMIGSAVAIRCEYSLWKHVPEATRMGATREEILDSCEYCHNDVRRAWSSLRLDGCASDS